METKTLTIAAVIIAATAAMAIAPTALGQAFARTVVESQTCENHGGHTKECSSPSCDTETTVTNSGEGQGKGERKTTVSSC